jgi:hypothetical protein
MKHKVCDLQGALLDAAVAKAEGHPIERSAAGCRVKPVDTGNWLIPGDPYTGYAPSTYWEDGGPIIARERISIVACEVRGQIGYFASTDKYGWCIDEDMGITGPTPLVAAMRAFVRAKLGDEVELP